MFSPASCKMGSQICFVTEKVMSIVFGGVILNDSIARLIKKYLLNIMLMSQFYMQLNN